MAHKTPPTMELIPIEEVPYKKETKWDELFKAIPKGQALVLREPDVNADGAAGALQRRKKRGQYKNLSVIVRGPKGKRVVYITNK